MIPHNVYIKDVSAYPPIRTLVPYSIPTYTGPTVLRCLRITINTTVPERFPRVK